MSQPTPQEPQGTPEPAPHRNLNLQLHRTETLETLYDLGASETPPRLDINYPEVGRQEDPLFPEEYTLETTTGLVPEKTLEQLRSRTSVATSPRRRRLSFASDQDLEKKGEIGRAHV